MAVPTRRKTKTKTKTLPARSNRAVTAATMTAVPAGYEQFNASTGLDFRPFIKTRRWVTGLHKVGGKTTLFSQQRNTAFLDFEEGSGHIPMGPGSVRFRFKNYAEFKEWYDKFKVDVRRDQAPFEHVVFDSVDRFVAFVAAHLTAVYVTGSSSKSSSIYDYGQGGLGNRLVAEGVLLFPRELTKLGVGWTAIGHLKWRMTRGEKGDEYQEMAASVAPLIDGGLSQDADFIWRCRSNVLSEQSTVKKQLVTNYTRVYYLETITPDEDAEQWTSADRGSRVPMLPLIEIPKKNGIGLVEREYEAACKREAQAWMD